MTTHIDMFDTVDPAAWPANPPAAAGYVDGHVGDQPDYAYIVRRFPKAFHLSIALSPAHDADCLDIEGGAASPASAAAWWERQKARGVARPALYASASVMQANVVPVITAARIPRDEVRLWSAHYGAGEHICGPGSCRLMGIDADGTQWTDRALGRDLDQSLLLADFFGAPAPVPPPSGTTWEELVALVPTIRKGDTGQAVKNWQGLLIARGHGLVPDGNFGVQTEQVTVAVQKALGVAQDGVVGPVTWKAALAG